MRLSDSAAPCPTAAALPGRRLIKCNFSLKPPPISFSLKIGLINQEKYEQKHEDSRRCSYFIRILRIRIPDKDEFLSPEAEFAGGMRLRGEANDEAHTDINPAFLGSGPRADSILTASPVGQASLRVAPGRWRGSPRPRQPL